MDAGNLQSTGLFSGDSIRFNKMSNEFLHISSIGCLIYGIGTEVITSMFPKPIS